MTALFVSAPNSAHHFLIWPPDSAFSLQAAMPALQLVLDALDSGLDASLERLFALMRIPSISTDSAYAADCRRAAFSLSLHASSIPSSLRPCSVSIPNRRLASLMSSTRKSTTAARRDSAA